MFVWQYSNTYTNIRKIVNEKGNREARLAHLISGLCPESISEHPGLDFSSWPSAAGIIRCFSRTIFEKLDLPYALWNFVQEQTVTSGDPLLLNFFFLMFRFQDINKFRTSGNNTKPLFHFKPSGIHFTETLFQTSIPCRVPSKELISWDFRPWKSAGGRTPQTCPAPAPTCAGIKYPVRGNPSL